MSSSAAGSSTVINVVQVEQYPWRRRLNGHHIYTIPNYLAKLNPDMYEPRMVSIGPISKPTTTDNGKVKILQVFLDKSEAKRDDYQRIFAKHMDYISNAYTGWRPGDGKKKATATEDMMITDGSFILEILTRGPRTTSNAVYYKDGNRRKYNNLTNHNDLPVIKQDMLLLQNQLPFWVLEVLYAGIADAGLQELRTGNYEPGNQLESRKTLLDLVVKFFSLPESTKEIKLPYLHILDIYRRGLISEGNQWEEKKTKQEDYKHDETTQYFPSASKLYEAGIPFKKSEKENLKDISFHRGTLRFPPFHITKYTAVTFANLIAFERLHGEACEVSSYIFFLNCLIRNAKDASLLESRGIIQHGLRDEDVVTLFGLIGNFVVDTPGNMLPELYMVSQQLTNSRFRKRLNIWRLDLFTNYLNSPWGALSVIAAILLIALTITQTKFAAVQTKYTVLSYVQSQKNTTN